MINNFFNLIMDTFVWKGGNRGMDFWNPSLVGSVGLRFCLSFHAHFVSFREVFAERKEKKHTKESGFSGAHWLFLQLEARKVNVRIVYWSLYFDPKFRHNTYNEMFYSNCMVTPDRLLPPTWSQSGQNLSHYHTIPGDQDPDKPCGACGPYIVRSGLVRVMSFCWWGRVHLWWHSVKMIHHLSVIW